jgi:acetoin utilization transport system permease protein
VQQINVFFLIMKIGLIFVGAIAVLIASIGIFNTMTMAVTERAQDIGIMKAIGAHPSVIKRIFLLESAMIGIIGAVFGTVVAYGISVAVNAGLPALVSMAMGETLPEGFRFSIIPAYLALLACSISLAVAMLSGYRPAKRATAIDVLSALRRDI